MRPLESLRATRCSLMVIFDHHQGAHRFMTDALPSERRPSYAIRGGALLWLSLRMRFLNLIRYLREASPLAGDAGFPKVAKQVRFLRNAGNGGIPGQLRLAVYQKARST